MAAYIIFIKEKTTNQEKLTIYSKEAPAGLVGYNITPCAVYGRSQVIEGSDVEGVAILNFLRLKKHKNGMKIRYTKKLKSIALREEYTRQS